MNPERAEANGMPINCMMSAEERMRKIRRMGIDPNEIHALTRSRIETLNSSGSDSSDALSKICCTSCLLIDCSLAPQLVQDLNESLLLNPHLSQIIKIPP